MRLDEIAVRPTLLFHATPATNEEVIRKGGLAPHMSQSSSRVIYLSDDRYTAENYACMRPDVEHILLQIDFSKLDQSKLGPDDYELTDVLDELPRRSHYYGMRWDDLTWQQSLALCNQVTYSGTIPPDAIMFLNSFRC